MWWQVMNGVRSSVSTYCFGFIKYKNIWSIIKRRWATLENNGLFPLSVAIWVWTSHLFYSGMCINLPWRPEFSRFHYPTEKAKQWEWEFKNLWDCLIKDMIVCGRCKWHWDCFCLVRDFCSERIWSHP